MNNFNISRAMILHTTMKTPCSNTRLNTFKIHTALIAEAFYNGTVGDNFQTCNHFILHEIPIFRVNIAFINDLTWFIINSNDFDTLLTPIFKILWRCISGWSCRLNRSDISMLPGYLYFIPWEDGYSNLLSVPQHSPVHDYQYQQWISQVCTLYRLTLWYLVYAHTR